MLGEKLRIQPPPGLRRVLRSRPLVLLRRALHEHLGHDGPTYAAAVSYYVLFSLFPLLIVMVSVFGILAEDSPLQQRTVNLILEQIPPGVNLGAQIEDIVSSVSETNTGWLGLAGLLGAIWTASGMVGALRRALNAAYDVPVARSYIHGRLIDLASIVSLGLLMLVSIAATALLGVFRAQSSHLISGFLPNLAWGLVYFLVPFVVSFLIFLLLYRLVPNLTLGLGDLWIGALVAAVGFELLKFGFGLYVANFGRYQEVYGAIGGVVAFLFFVFLVANVVLLSAELNSEIAKERAGLAGYSTGDHPTRRI